MNFKRVKHQKLFEERLTNSWQIQPLEPKNKNSEIMSMICWAKKFEKVVLKCFEELFQSRVLFVFLSAPKATGPTLILDFTYLLILRLSRFLPSHHIDAHPNETIQCELHNSYTLRADFHPCASHRAVCCGCELKS